MRALVTNDDGINSPGLHHLAAAALEQGLEVVVAAPARESSGSSAAITAGVGAEGRIPLERRQLRGVVELSAYAVGAAPALISLIAAHGTFGPPPAVVLSGVNHGANVGQAILHSGTVGAALTAGINKSRGLAVSLDVGLEPEGEAQWATAAKLACQLLPQLLQQREGTVLNLNVPDVKPDQVAGLRAAPLAPFGIVHTTMTERSKDHVRLTVADASELPPEGSDAALLVDGYATLTALSPVCAGDQSMLAELIASTEQATPASA